MVNGWKILAIILLVVFILENSLIVYGYISNKQIEKETNICGYDVCKEYEGYQYDYSSKICDCYSKDLMGYDVLSKSEYMGKR